MDRKNFIAYSYVCDERKVAKYVLEIANIIFWDDCKIMLGRTFTRVKIVDLPLKTEPKKENWKLLPTITLDKWYYWK